MLLSIISFPPPLHLQRGGQKYSEGGLKKCLRGVKEMLRGGVMQGKTIGTFFHEGGGYAENRRLFKGGFLKNRRVMTMGGGGVKNTEKLMTSFMNAAKWFLFENRKGGK